MGTEALLRSLSPITRTGVPMSIIPPKAEPSSADELSRVSDDWIARARLLLDRGILYRHHLAGEPPCSCRGDARHPCLACLASAASRRMAERAGRRPPPLLPFENIWDDDGPSEEN